MIHKQAIETLFADLEARWCALDLLGIRALWADIAQPVYIAEEHGALMTQWSDVEAYWAATLKSIAQFRSRYRVEAVVPLGDDLASVTFRLRWTATLVADASRIGGVNRGIATVRHTHGGVAQFVTYAEAPLAPITYLRGLYRLAADAPADWLG
jgi:hypothetical protein